MRNLATALKAAAGNVGEETNPNAWDLAYADIDSDDTLAWDVSTASFSSYFNTASNTSSQHSDPYDVFFKPDGTKMYTVSRSTDTVYEYDLSTAWMINTASFNQSQSVSSTSPQPRGLFFKSDGTKMYTADSNQDEINEYDLSTAWDVSTISHNQEFSVSSQEGNPSAVFFKPDGTKMYMTGPATDKIYEYNLSTGWDISTASLNQNISVAGTSAGQENAPSGLYFKSDGTIMYFIGSSRDRVIRYNLSTAWDVSTASYSAEYHVNSQEGGPRGVHFKPDGSKFFIAGDVTGGVHQYSTGAIEFSVSTQTQSGVEVQFKADGTKMFVLDNANNEVLEYSLSTAWDVSTATYTNNSFSVQSQENKNDGMYFKPDGSQMYIAGKAGDDVNEYDLSTDWDITTASYQQNFDISSQIVDAGALWFKPDGTKMYLVGFTNDRVSEYDLSTAWDVSTASHNQNLSISSTVTNPRGLSFKPDGTIMYILDRSADDVNQFALNTAWDISTASFSKNFGVQDADPLGFFFKPDGTKFYVMAEAADKVLQYKIVEE